jgi:hypothetical protein
MAVGSLMAVTTCLLALAGNDFDQNEGGIMSEDDLFRLSQI